MGRRIGPVILDDLVPQIMLQKPATAPTGRPSDFRVSGGNAW
jgi:hypothetical protein